MKERIEINEEMEKEISELNRVIKNQNDMISTLKDEISDLEDTESELECDLENAYNKINDLENELTFINSTLHDKMKYDIFIEHRDNITPWELEKLLTEYVKN